MENQGSDLQQQAIPQAPGVRPSKRERDKLKTPLAATVKPEGSRENERDAAAALVEGVAGVKPEGSTLKGDEDSPKNPGGEGEPEGGEPEGGEGKPAGLKELAKKLEMQPKELYEVAVPMGAGLDSDSKTIGELKDFYQRNWENRERLNTVDREEMEFRSNRMRAMQELDQLVSLLPAGAVKPEYIQQVQQQARVMAHHEIKRLVAVEPSFADPVAFQAARQVMGETAQAYGLTGADVDNIVDHRWILALHDLAQLRAARDKAKSLIPEHHKASGHTPQGTQQRAASSNQSRKNKGKPDPVSQALGVLIQSNKRG